MKFISIITTAFWLFLFPTLVHSLPRMDETLTEECMSACRRLFLDDSTCKPAMKTLHYHACHEGKKRAFDESCVDRCTSKGVMSRPFVATPPYHVCKHHVQPQKMYWCRKGFVDFSKKMKSTAGSFLSAENEKELNEKELAINSSVDYNKSSHGRNVRVDPPVIELKGIVEKSCPGRKQSTENDHENETEHSALDSKLELDLEILGNTTTQASHENVVSSNSDLAINYHLNKLPLWYKTEVDGALIPVVGAGVAKANSSAPMHPFLELTDHQAFEKALTRSTYAHFFLVTVGGSVEEHYQPSNTQYVDGVISFIQGTNLILPVQLLREFTISQDNIWIHRNRAKIKELDAHTAFSYTAESLNASRVLSTTKNEIVSKSVQSMYHEGSVRIEVTFGCWSLENFRILESPSTTMQPDLDEIDPGQLSFGEWSHIWPRQVPFDQRFNQEHIHGEFERFQCSSELEELDCPSNKPRSAGTVLPSICCSLEPPPNYLRQDLPSTDLMYVNDHLLLDKCNFAPRIDTSFMTAANSDVKSQSKKLCNAVNNGPNNFRIQKDAIRLELVLSHHISSSQAEEVGGPTGIGIFQSCSSFHFELTDHHHARKALERGHTEERGVFISCIEGISPELCMPRSTLILIQYESFATSQLHLWKYPHRAKLKEHHVHSCHLLHITTNPSATGFVWSETSIGYEMYCHDNHREIFEVNLTGSSWSQSLAGPRTLESSSTTVIDLPAAISPLQLSFGVSSHSCPVYSRLKSVDCQISRSRTPPKHYTRGCLDEVDSVQLCFGHFACICTAFSSCKVLLLHLSLSISSDCVILDADTIASKVLIESIYQIEGRDNSHLDRGVLEAGHPFSNRHLGLNVAFVLLMLYCYYRQSALRSLGSPIIASHDVTLTPEEIIIIDWEFQRWQQLICITSLLVRIDSGWTNASKIQLAAKALRFKFELTGLHSELGPYWIRFSHCGRHGRRSSLSGRQKPP
jgi:hypothetical protein